MGEIYDFNAFKKKKEEELKNKTENNEKLADNFEEETSLPEIENEVISNQESLELETMRKEIELQDNKKLEELRASLELGNIDNGKDDKEEKAGTGMTPEEKAEFDKDMKDMKEKGEKRIPEVEAKYRAGLEDLFERIQKFKGQKEEFPSKETLRRLVDENSVFSKMQEGAKREFTKALSKHKEYKSDDQDVFVAKGMEFMYLFIHLEAAKKGGNEWLGERHGDGWNIAEDESGNLSVRKAV